MSAYKQQSEDVPPKLLQWSFDALDRLEHAYPAGIASANIYFKDMSAAFQRWHLLGLLLVWIIIIRELQFHRLPGDPLFHQALKQIWQAHPLSQPRIQSAPRVISHLRPNPIIRQMPLFIITAGLLISLLPLMTPSVGYKQTADPQVNRVQIFAQPQIVENALKGDADASRPPNNISNPDVISTNIQGSEKNDNVTVQPQASKAQPRLVGMLIRLCLLIAVLLFLLFLVRTWFLGYRNPVYLRLSFKSGNIRKAHHLHTALNAEPNRASIMVTKLDLGSTDITSVNTYNHLVSHIQALEQQLAAIGTSGKVAGVVSTQPDNSVQPRIHDTNAGITKLSVQLYKTKWERLQDGARYLPASQVRYQTPRRPPQRLSRRLSLQLLRTHILSWGVKSGQT